MKKSLAGLIWTVISTALVYLFVYHFFGETYITATIDGEALHGATVEIDGEIVGTTPYKDRLGSGSFTIRVIPPEDIDVLESEYKYYMWSVVLGKDFVAPFDSRKPEISIEEERVVDDYREPRDGIDLLVASFDDGQYVEGLSVRINGERVGETPLFYDLPPGDFEIVVESPRDDRSDITWRVVADVPRIKQNLTANF